MALTVDDWAGQSFNFCKPVAKYPDDRQALRDIVKEGTASSILLSQASQICPSGHPRFFLGSDSAPHLQHSKSTSTPSQGCAAGVYTSPILLPLVAHLLESFGALDKLGGFVSSFGRAFYKREASEASDFKVLLQRTPAGKAVIDDRYVSDNDVVVPFWAGKAIGWKIV